MKFINAVALSLGLVAMSGCAAEPISSQAAQAQATIVIKAPMSRVWQLITQIDKWPEWNPIVQSSTLHGNVSKGSIFVWMSDGSTITSTLQEVRPFKRLTWSGIALGTQAFHTWDFEESDRGVIVHTGETFDGWLPRLMTGMMQNKLDETLPKWLESLKSASEKLD
jgi:uncharacterized protein YndB with AHSA1/START domain